MDSAIIISNGHSGATLTQWNAPELELIKSQIAPNCSDGELALFGQVCQRTGLDPFTRQIYAIKRGSGDRAKMTIQTSIDGFRLIADRSGHYDGNETFWCAPDGVWRDVWLENTPPAAAKTVVWKRGSDRPFTGVARWGSYKQEFFDKQSQSWKLGDMWQKFPDLMLGKCSEALALRKAFPAELSGLYTSEEMAQATQAAPVQELINAHQRACIRDALTNANISFPDFGLWLQNQYGVSKVTDLPATEFQEIGRAHV